MRRKLKHVLAEVTPEAKRRTIRPLGTTDRLEIRIDPQLEWWRPLVQWFLCLPHLLYVGVLTVLAFGAAVGVAASVLATGRVPRRLGAFQVMYLRERARCFSCFWVLRTSVPPYATGLTTTVDPGDDPMVTVSLDVPERLPRTAALTRPLAVLPHLLVLAPIGIVLDVCYPVWMLVAAVNRGWTPGTAAFLVRAEGWVVAAVGYAFLVTDRRPGFGVGRGTAWQVAATAPPATQSRSGG